MFIGTLCALTQEGSAGGMIAASARAMFRLRLISKSAIMPSSSAPDKMPMPPISRGLFSELGVEVSVFVLPVFPVFVPLIVGVWLLPAVGDALAVGEVTVAVALALVVGVAAGVVDRKSVV